MIKTTLTAFVIALGLSLGTAPVWAEEVDCVIDPTNEACLVTTSDELPFIPSDYPEQNANDADDDSEVIIDEEVEETEPAMWPAYLSLGALGLAILVFIVLNLFGGRKRK